MTKLFFARDPPPPLSDSSLSLPASIQGCRLNNCAPLSAISFVRATWKMAPPLRAKRTSETARAKRTGRSSFRRSPQKISNYDYRDPLQKKNPETSL